jgi:hypothetical protein
LLTAKPGSSRIRKNSAGRKQESRILTNSATKDTNSATTRWNEDDTVGLKHAKSEIVNVEYFRDVRPILLRSCAACHSQKSKEPAGNLVLDADDEREQYRHIGKFPGTYYRIALDERAKHGHKPFGYDSWGYPNASRYIRKFQSRRSLLVWKLFGKRLDGFHNDDHPSPAKPGDRTTLLKAGQPVDPKRNRARWDLDYEGSSMPPPAAVKAGKVKPLSDEDRRTIVRWIDLGCPIDLDYDAAKPQAAGYGWMLDDNRPILTMTFPRPGTNAKLDRIVIGMHDYYSGLDDSSLRVTATFAIDGVPPGTNLASRFKRPSRGVRELRLSRPIESLRSGEIAVSVRDRQGNVTTIARTISVK